MNEFNVMLYECVLISNFGVIDFAGMVTLLKVNNVGWTVDASPSTATTSSSSARPLVLLTLELSDGTSQIFHLDLQSFGQLRCKVAELLAELQLVHDRMQARPLPEIRKMDS